MNSSSAASSRIFKRISKSPFYAYRTYLYTLTFSASAFLAGLFVGRDYLSKTERQTQQVGPTGLSDAAVQLHFPAGAAFLPTRDNVVIHEEYMAGLSHYSKTPLWVAEKVSKTSAASKAAKRDEKFAESPSVPPIFRATNGAYFHSGYSRGHLAPAGQHKSSQAIQDETFLLNDNIVPQDLSMNGCDWYRLEQLQLDLAKNYENVYVISGPAMVPIPDLSPEVATPGTSSVQSKPKVLTVPHRVISEDGVTGVHVPTHMWKAIRVVDKQKGIDDSAVFLMPNEPILEEKDLTEYLVPLETLAKHTGLVLDQAIPNNKLCTVVKCNKETAGFSQSWRAYGILQHWSGEYSRPESSPVHKLEALRHLRRSLVSSIDAGYLNDRNFLLTYLIRDKVPWEQALDLKDPSVSVSDSKKYKDVVQQAIATVRK